MIRKNSAARTFLCLLLAFVFAASCLPQTIFATTDKKQSPPGPKDRKTIPALSVYSMPILVLFYTIKTWTSSAILPASPRF